MRKYPDRLGENNKTFSVSDVFSTHIRFVGHQDFRLVQYQLLMKDASDKKLKNVR